MQGLLYSLRYFKNNDFVLLFPTLQVSILLIPARIVYLYSKGNYLE